jgi:hypothetical protein
MPRVPVGGGEEAMTTLTVERLREVLDYNPDTGVFLRRLGNGRGMKAGDIAGWVDSAGYRRICVDGRIYSAHRLAWLYVHDRWPVGDLDHRHGKEAGNGIANLREVSESENMQNQRRAQRHNKTGLLGVSPYYRKFRAAITVDGKQNYLGYFETAELAHAAYLEAKRRLHPAGML